MGEPIKTVELIVWSPLTALLLRVWAALLLLIGVPVVIRIWRAAYGELRDAVKKLER